MAVPPPNRSASPLPAHPTKRDVRRTRIADRLQMMIDSFSTNQPSHYRAQLQAVQVDMTLVLRADPYDGQPLLDSGEDVSALVESRLAASTFVGGSDAEGGAVQRDYLALAGRRYAEFAGEVNDELEQRDADLAALHNAYHSSVAALERATQEKIHQAEEEHKALSNTIRSRLHATISKKRQLLLRDKEQLDIGDSNALLLHPNQFSINHQSSPGGTGLAGQNRKTRHLRHRAASPSAGDLGENGGLKKKRKGLDALDDAGNESGSAPLTSFPEVLPRGTRSPKKDHAYTQFEAPAYSLERIFTDKELALASATAQQATYRCFHLPQVAETTLAQVNGNGTATAAASTTAEMSIDGEVLPDAPVLLEGEEVVAVRPTTETAASPPPAHAAPEMERTASTQTQVFTRNTARLNPLAALGALAEAAASSSSGLNALATLGAAQQRVDVFAPVLPAFTAVARSEKSGAPTPSGVGLSDVEGDLEMMRRGGSGSTGPGLTDTHDFDPSETPDDSARAFRTTLLDKALSYHSSGLPPFRSPLTELGPAIVGPRIDRPTWTGFAQYELPAPVGRKVAATSAAAGGMQGLTGFGGTVPRGLAGAGGGVVGAMASAVGGTAGGEAMSRISSAQGSETGVEGLGGAIGGGGKRRRGVV
ncbi:hypothetical protein LTR62_001432 [Meristemomyces frigidus]|uniref:Uncharacterized protein n=1 Tax=Meristemomyces frigidus TaxID=1508187 RepID=A0AAN7TTN2_9PEZI|nr:hypothetical protein LTR62_001432 [Meristemomyces frigidus]